ncbi:hypothetical protein PBY51_018958 [Eleginops maclovinus]|uniref:Uncharacterized protein n=1 Tax=Eleginops maclovinus TaxID=56733 RepID=A0AAN7Y9J2_ELEMC|nr:hypothetical protein PBY51_018958 [Eleginops maclovinus]
MDASQWREEPCSVPIVLHCRKLIKTLPSKFTPALACPTLTIHPSLNLPPPSLSKGSSPSQHDRQAQLTVPVSGERKQSREVK